VGRLMLDMVALMGHGLPIDAGTRKDKCYGVFRPRLVYTWGRDGRKFSIVLLIAGNGFPTQLLARRCSSGPAN